MEQASVFSLTWRNLIGIFLCLSFMFIVSCETKPRRRVCYYPNWSQYKPAPATFVVSNIDPWACTHFLYAFAKIKDDYVLAYEVNDDQDPFMWSQFTNLRQRNPAAVFLIALGGYSYGTGEFSAIAASPTRRRSFIRNLIDFARYWRFQGFDFDWEYPASYDRDNFSVLMKEVREACESEAVSTGRERLILATALPAGIPRIREGFDVGTLALYMDFISVMTYDYHGPWENFTSPATPLYAPEGDDLSLDKTMKYYVENGVPKDKLNVGLALYGRSWTLNKSGDTAMGSVAVSGGTAGRYTRQPGFLAYYEICGLLNNGYVEHFDPVAQVKYCTLGNQFVTYEDASTLRTKVDYIVDNDYGGIMVWSVDHDDFNGQFCGKGSWPLMNVIVSNLRDTTDTPVNTTTSTTTSTSSTTSTTSTSKSTSTSTSRSPTTSSSSPPSTTSPGQTPTPSTAAPATTAAPTAGRQFECTKEGGIFPDKQRGCKYYKICLRDFLMSMECHGDNVFHPTTKRCVSPTSYQC